MKKTITILLVLTVLVNAFGFGFLNVRSSAIAPIVEAFGQALMYVIKGAMIGSAASVGVQTVEGISQAQQDKILQDSQCIMNDLDNNNLVCANYNEDTHCFYFTVSPDVSADSAEFAQRLTDKLNENNELFHYVDIGSADGNTRISAKMYEKIKNDVTNEYCNYVTNKEMAAARAELGDELAEATGMQPYDFSFIGPILPYQQPMITSSGFVDRNVNGYLFFSPVSIDREDGNTSYPISYMFGEKANSSGNAESGYTTFVDVPISGYGYGDFVLYGGKVYCRSFYSSNELDSRSIYIANSPGGFDVASSFVDENGISLTDAGCTSFVGCAYGIYVKQNPEAPAIPTTQIKESDLQSTTSIGGASIPGMPTSAEEQIRKAIASGVLTTNPMLQVNEQGEIVGADGLTMEQIQNIVNNITNNTTTNNTTNVDLSNVEKYLAAIKQACIDSGVDIGKIERIINNVKDKIKDYSGSLADILSAINGVKELEDDKLTTIADQTAAIAEALTAAQTITAEKKLDIDTPSSITDKFPFSLPFDVYNTFNLLSAEPVAPKFSFPLKMDGVFEYNIDVDLSEYEWIAVIVRWLIFAACVVGLILATNKLIGRG